MSEQGNILFIDPSARALGWAVMNGKERVSSGTWYPSKSKHAADRFDQLAGFVGIKLSYMDDAQIVRVVVETSDKPLYKMKGIDAITYGRAIGVVEGAAYPIPVSRLPVSQWKRNAKKGWTLIEVKAVLGYTPSTDNECDALGMGIYWYRNARLYLTQMQIEEKLSREDRDARREAALSRLV